MKDTDKVTILNYNENYVFIPTEVRTYTLTPMIDGVPSQVTLPFSEIAYVNGQSDAFRTGMLSFQSDKPEKIYEALNICDYDQILTNDDIEKILLHPTIEGLQRILDVRNQSTFDRIRAVYVSLKNSDSCDLSNRVVKLMEKRTEEFRVRKFKTDIILKQADTESDNIESETVTELKSQLEEMKKMMATFIANQADGDKLNKKVDITTEED